jgi:hypothetical protein
VNFVIFVASGRGSVFWTNALLHPFITATNLDSVLNDVGMLMVCGSLKHLRAQIQDRLNSVGRR